MLQRGPGGGEEDSEGVCALARHDGALEGAQARVGPRDVHEPADERLHVEVARELDVREVREGYRSLVPGCARGGAGLGAGMGFRAWAVGKPFDP